MHKILIHNFKNFPFKYLTPYTDFKFEEGYINVKHHNRFYLYTEKIGCYRHIVIDAKDYAMLIKNRTPYFLSLKERKLHYPSLHVSSKLHPMTENVLYITMLSPTERFLNKNKYDFVITKDPVPCRECDPDRLQVFSSSILGGFYTISEALEYVYFLDMLNSFTIDSDNIMKEILNEDKTVFDAVSTLSGRLSNYLSDTISNIGISEKQAWEKILHDYY